MRRLLLAAGALLLVVLPAAGEATAGAGSAPAMPWWGWVILLFALSAALGVVAVLGGVGGGVLYVPIVCAFFPFHMDFVRCAGLILAMAGALSAAPRLIHAGYVSLRLAFPAALIASVFSVFGAMVGLALPERMVQVSMGAAILGVAAVVLLSRRSYGATVQRPDALARLLQIGGGYEEPVEGSRVEWTVHRTIPGYLAFIAIGVLGGMFGLGAGWANVPVLNLLMGAPLKVAAGTSAMIISINSTAAAWVYVNRGAVLPLLVLPSVAGMILGTRLGARLLPRVRPRLVRYVVVVLLGASGVQSILRGLGG